MSDIRNVSSRARVILLSLGHFINDIHANFLPTFLPSLIESLGLSLTQAGLLTSLPGLIHVSCQPVLGYFSDKYTRPFMIIAGPLLSAVGASLIPVSPGFALAFIFTGIWGLGSASFHPQGLGAVGYLSRPENISFSLSLFQVGGALGVTISPLYAAFLAKTFGFSFMPLICLIPVIPLVIAYILFIPSLDPEGNREDPGDGMFPTIKKVFVNIWPVWTVAFARDISINAVRFLIPVLISSRGGGLAKIGAVLFVLNLSRSALTVAVARISDKIGRKKVLSATLLLGPVFMVPSIMIEGLASTLFLLTGFAIIGCSLPITASMAQEKAPGSRSTASSLIMGVSFGLSGMMMTPIGALADIAGLHTTLMAALSLPLLSLLTLAFGWRKMD